MGIAVGLQPSRSRMESGQMTVELAVCIPVLVAVALVVFNALVFLGHCAAFDRLAKDAVRMCATAPAHGQSAADSAARVQALLDAAFPQDYLSVTVGVSGSSPGFLTFTATLSYTPTLFGRPFSGRVFNVLVGVATHSARLVVDPYRPGAIV